MVQDGAWWTRGRGAWCRMGTWWTMGVWTSEMTSAGVSTTLLTTGTWKAAEAEGRTRGAGAWWSRAGATRGSEVMRGAAAGRAAVWRRGAAALWKRGAPAAKMGTGARGAVEAGKRSWGSASASASASRL